MKQTRLRPRPVTSIVSLLAALILGTVAASAQAAETRVTDAAGLQAALKATKGGVIVLAPGSYGDLQLGRTYPQTVTLRAETPRTAEFGQILVRNGGNMAFEGLKTSTQFRADRSKHLAISGCISGLLYFRDVSGLDVSDCDIGGGKFGALFNTVQDFKIVHNRIGRVSEDVMRITGDSRNGLLEYNFFDDVIAVPPTHPDLLQLFAQRGKTPENITIRRNLFYDDVTTGAKRMAQGIFMSDPGPTGYRNMLVEENLINTRSPNTIYIYGGEKNVVIRNNTLLPSPGDGGAVIRLAKRKHSDNSGTTVVGNAAKMILDETKVSDVKTNYFYGRKAALPRLYSGPGGRWQDYLSVLGSVADTSKMGARTFLAELLAGQKDGGVHIGPDWMQ